MIRVVTKGDGKRTTNFLKRMLSGDVFSDLHRYGRLGVDALAKSTPVDTGLTANSWNYRIIKDRRGPGIEWYNTNVSPGGTSVAILIQYGHGTGSGGYVSGRDYINPTMRPVFDRIADEIWKKVKS